MKAFIIVFCLFYAYTSSCQQAEDSFFEGVNIFLINNVENGRINYNALKFNDQNLSGLTEQVASMDLTDKSDDFKLAFYINAYNLLVIYQVLDKYPINSPMEVRGFFKERKFKVAGEDLTLDEIEFDRIFEPYQDPRIHFALGCAAKSCPFLYDNAFTPQHIQEQLEFRAQLIIDLPSYVDVDEKRKTVTFNKIFNWYEDQFVDNAGSLIDFVNKYRFYKVPKDYKIQFQEYDWSLNRLKQ